MCRPVVLLLYAAVFVGEAMWSAIVPLVPAFARPGDSGALHRHIPAWRARRPRRGHQRRHVAALLNIVGALSALVGPIAAGALAQTAGDRAAYGVMAVLCVVVASAVASGPPRLRSAAS